MLPEVDPASRVLVVDDGSTDDTTKVMDELMREHPSVELLTHRHNLGKAAALQNGFARAVEGQADVVVMMDADGQDDPAELPALVARLRDGADLVTGARIVRQDRFVKRTTSRLYNRTTACISGAPGRDFNSGYKVMRARGRPRRLADAVRRDAPLPDRDRALAWATGWPRCRCEHHPRLAGESKYGLARFWRGFADLLTVRFLLSYEHRPSHLFGGVGLVSLVIGMLTLVYLTGVKITGGAIGDRPLLIAGVLMTHGGAPAGALRPAGRAGGARAQQRRAPPPFVSEAARGADAAPRLLAWRPPSSSPRASR